MKQYIESDKYSFPKLCNRGGDISKSWYVYFDYTHEGKTKQIRIKRGINLIKNKKERESAGKGLINAILNELGSGWNPITDQVEKLPQNQTVIEAVENILSIKKSYITKETYRTYDNAIKLFSRWIESKNYSDLYIQNFTKKHAQEYLDYLLKEKSYCGKTYNGYLGNLRTFFSDIEERFPAIINPFKGIKTLPEDVGSNTTYSEEEQKRITEYLINNDKNFYLAICFVKYCFLRRTELSKLQIKHIRWDNKTIIIPSKSAKSRKQDSITIGKTFEKILWNSGVLKLNPEMYVFGHPGKLLKPSFEKMKRLDDFSDRQREVNNLLNIKEECSFYSWKHTGVCELYNLTKDIYVVMRQCRHSDVKITLRYLRSLGLGVSEQVRAW